MAVSEYIPDHIVVDTPNSAFTDEQVLTHVAHRPKFLVDGVISVYDHLYEAEIDDRPASSLGNLDIFLWRFYTRF